MNKIEFAAELERLLQDLPEEERKRSVDFYSEMIDDRMEDGESEEAAVAGLGSPRSVADGIMENAAGSISRRRKIDPWMIVLAVMASPIWLPILVSAAAVVLSLFVSVWSVILSFAAAAIGIAAGAVGGAGVSAVMFVTQPLADAVFILGCSIMLAGVAIFGVYASERLIVLSAKGTARLFKWSVSAAGAAGRRRA